MIVSRLILKNWRNFRSVDVPLRERQFIVGPNASGKSNLLDVFRFLRDIAKLEGGGLQQAIKRRAGVSKLRCLTARQDPEIVIEVHLADGPDSEPRWRYTIGIRQETRGSRQPYLTHERVWRADELLIDRPDEEDNQDRERLKQTFLEQVNVNRGFREIARFLETVTYLHLIPQLLRHADSFSAHPLEDDPFGQSFLERIAKTTERAQRSRLKKIEQGLRIAVPQLKELQFERDADTGRPHLSAIYSHWRPKAGRQREDQFSDGTLRLIGLLWSMLESESLLLLEEPELSLNAGIVTQLAPLIHQMQRQKKRQMMISTHSYDLLSDQGIDGREVLLLTPHKEGTTVECATNISDVRVLLESGLSPADAVLPRTKPENVAQLRLF
jgi:predicted ATPase